jgi:hypothetical protein
VAPGTRATAWILTCAAVLVVGCGTPRQADPASAATPASSPPTTIAEPVTAEQLRTARSAGDPRRFAALVSRAAASCPDPDAARSLGQASAVAERWADAIALARPKVQARTEAQLSAVTWETLLAACARG